MKLCLGEKGQAAIVGVVVAAIIIMLGAVVLAQVYEAIPSDMTGTSNTTTYEIADDTLDNFALAPIAILAAVIALILGALLIIRRA